MVWANEPDSEASVARSTFTPARSISASTRRERPLQRLIDRGHGFGGEPRLQHQPEPEPDIGLLARIFGGARRCPRDRSSTALRARAHDLLLGEAGIAEQPAGELARQMLGAAGVERVGHQAGIVDASSSAMP